jgi:hypothetical protein
MPSPKPNTPADTPFPLLRWGTWLARGELNPVFVKEMRQAVRGRLVLSMFLLALMVMFGLSAWMLLTMDFDRSGFGAQLFATLLGALTLLTAVCVPAWSGGRMLNERHGAEGVDLLYYTPMTAEEIIQGKFLSNVTLAAVFFSAGAPFLAVTPLLRGVDVPTVIMVTLLHFLTVVLVCQAGLVLASLPVSRVWKGVIGACAALCGAPFLFIWIGICMSYVFSTGGMGMPLLFFFPTAIVFGLLGLNVLIVMAASYIAPMKRLRARRGALAVTWSPPMRPEPPPLPRAESPPGRARQGS